VPNTAKQIGTTFVKEYVMGQQATQLVSISRKKRAHAVERIGTFAAAARAQQLKPKYPTAFKRMCELKSTLSSGSPRPLSP